MRWAANKNAVGCQKQNLHVGTSACGACRPGWRLRKSLMRGPLPALPLGALPQAAAGPASPSDNSCQRLIHIPVCGWHQPKTCLYERQVSFIHAWRAGNANSKRGHVVLTVQVVKMAQHVCCLCGVHMESMQWHLWLSLQPAAHVVVCLIRRA